MKRFPFFFAACCAGAAITYGVHFHEILGPACIVAMAGVVMYVTKDGWR